MYIYLLFIYIYLTRMNNLYSPARGRYINRTGGGDRFIIGLRKLITDFRLLLLLLLLLQ